MFTCYVNMDYKQLYILGSGGHGKVVADIALTNKVFKKVYFLDDNYDKKNIIDDVKIVGDLSENTLVKINKKQSAFITAFGDGFLRSKYHQILKNLDLQVISLIHKSSKISHFSKIKLGSVICAGSIIGPNVEIGEGVIINHNSTVDHDCKIGNFVHICPGVNLAGGVSIQQFTHIGIGSSIIQGINIGKECLVGAGSVVLKNIENNKKVVGVPAKTIK